MRTRKTTAVAFALLALIAALCLPTLHGAQAAPSGPRAEAQRILKTSGINGGLVVHLGCGDGRLTASLRANENILVHGLDTNPDAVRQARAHIRELGIYGPVSVKQFDGTHLPYAGNLVNLLVAENLGDVPRKEAMRVLAPGGVLCVKENGKWKKSIKSHPDDTDEWTHFLHDASGNAVADDDRVGPPRYARWISEPRYTRSHEHTPSIHALVSADDRIYYIADRASITSLLEPPEWNIIARDAHNGLLLWKRPFAPWLSHLHMWGAVRPTLQRRLVAGDDRLYVTLGFFAPVSALDASSGEKIRTYEQTRGAEEIIHHDGVLLVAARQVTDERVAQLEKWKRLARQKDSPIHNRDKAEPLENEYRQARHDAKRRLLAIDTSTGKTLWKKDTGDLGWIRPLTLSAVGDRVLYQQGTTVNCVELTSGKKLWATDSIASQRTVGEGRVVCANGNSIEVLSLETGERLWKKPTVLKNIRDGFIIDGSLWLGGFEEGTDWKDRPNPVWGPMCATERDLETGKLLKHIKSDPPGHHHRCYQNKATTNYLLTGRRGIEFIDTETGEFRWNSWVRGVCKYGIMPANGLVYAPPHACACYVSAKLEGFFALSADNGPPSPVRQPKKATLERGPAYSAKLDTDDSENGRAWPTYRHDSGRSSHTSMDVPAKLEPAWRTELGGKLSAPTIADGRLTVASVNSHTVTALDAESGDALWDFTAGGRVDSPPTLHGGRALFGSRDGYVYSVRASDGKLGWRLQAARDQRLITTRRQLESASPLHGSVLVRDGVAYFTAGRSSYLGDGIDLYRVRPETGKILSRTSVYSPDPETGRQPEQYGPAYMPGARWAILSSDDEHVYMRDSVFTHGGEAIDERSPHLFTLTGFLDENWAHRSYWVFGSRCSISTGCSGQDNGQVYGRILAFDGPVVYGFGRARLHWSNMLQDGPYRLFAFDRDSGKERWTKRVGVQVRALVMTDDVMFAAGPRHPVSPGDDGVIVNDRGIMVPAKEDEADDEEVVMLYAFSTKTGKKLAEYELDAVPAWDGMAAAYGRLYISCTDGTVLCMKPAR